MRECACSFKSLYNIRTLMFTMFECIVNECVPYFMYDVHTHTSTAAFKFFFQCMLLIHCCFLFYSPFCIMYYSIFVFFSFIKKRENGIVFSRLFCVEHTLVSFRRVTCLQNVFFYLFWYFWSVYIRLMVPQYSIGHSCVSTIISI